MLYELGFTDKDRQDIHDDLIRKEEKSRIIELMNRNICFGHREENNCEHQLCWGLRNLIDKLEQETK